MHKPQNATEAQRPTSEIERQWPAVVEDSGRRFRFEIRFEICDRASTFELASVPLCLCGSPLRGIG